MHKSILNLCFAPLFIAARLRAFRAFLLKEFSDENLDFYLEIESYKKQKQSRQLKLAPAIYVTYIQAGASREVGYVIVS